jgi:hypothetical protein
MTDLPSTTDSTKPVAARQRLGPARSADEYIGFNGRLAAALTRRAGSMWVVYFTIVFMLVWMGPLSGRCAMSTRIHSRSCCLWAMSSNSCWSS